MHAGSLTETPARCVCDPRAGARFGFSGAKVFKKSNNQSFQALEAPEYIEIYALAQDANMAKCSCSGFCLSERLIICIFEHFSHFRGISGLAWLGGADGLPRTPRVGSAAGRRYCYCCVSAAGQQRSAVVECNPRCTIVREPRKEPPYEVRNPRRSEQRAAQQLVVAWFSSGRSSVSLCAYLLSVQKAPG